MKKLLGIVVLGLLLSGNAFAKDYFNDCQWPKTILSYSFDFKRNIIEAKKNGQTFNKYKIKSYNNGIIKTDIIFHKELKMSAFEYTFNIKDKTLISDAYSHKDGQLTKKYRTTLVPCKNVAIITLSKKEIEIAKKKKQQETEKQKLTLKFGPECENNNLVKGTSEYNDCLNNKIDSELVRQKELAKKLAAMTPTERHAYNCTETFKFKKGTEKFNDCVFKLYTAELDLQKLELEKEVAEAKIKAAATEQARAEAVANAQIAAAKSAKRSSDLNNSIQLMKLGSSMLGGSTSTSSSSNSFDINNRTRTTCRVVGGFLNCY